MMPGGCAAPTLGLPENRRRSDRYDTSRRKTMATLVAIAYDGEGTAEEARRTVQTLEADLVIQADQVAAISRDTQGKYHVTTTHGGASAGGGAWWGGFWG